MMMMSITDNRCSVCRGDASTSTAQCQCPAPTDRSPSSSTRCINCGVLTASSLCARCKALPRCRRRKRHLPKRCFLQFDGDGDDQEDGGNVNDSSEVIDKRSTVCRTCDKRRSRFTVRKSTDNVVTEIETPTTDAVHRSFESFIQIHQDQVRVHVEERRQLHRYVVVVYDSQSVIPPTHAAIRSRRRLMLIAILYLNEILSASRQTLCETVTFYGDTGARINIVEQNQMVLI